MAQSHPEELRQAVLADYSAGMTYKVMSAKHNVSPETMRSWVIAAGLPGRYDMRSTPARKRTNTNALTGGEWVADHMGVQRWIPDEEEAS